VLAAIASALLAGCGSDSTQTDWVLREEPDGDTLLVDVAVGNSCNYFDRIDVDENDDQVIIKSYSSFSLSVGDGCDDLLKVERHTVQLDQPLADRKLDGCHTSGSNVLSRDVEDCRTVVPVPTVTPEQPTPNP
jgi:hypothetical protein